MTTKIKFVAQGRNDPRIHWIMAEERFKRIDYDWFNEQLIFEDDEDAVAYSLKFNERPCVTSVSDS